MNETQISEETIASMVEAAQNIATNSTAMRLGMVAIADAIHPILQRAGIRFGSLDDDQQWSSGEYPDQWTHRIGIMKVLGEWDMGVEETQWYPQYWDGSNWIGHTDPFCDSAYNEGAATFTQFSQISRDSLVETIKLLPEFINLYCDELKRRHLQYADLRKKAEAMLKIVEG